MATFHPNPNEETEPWIERAVHQNSDFRAWHVMFFCFSTMLSILIVVCCCVKIRIPRTKQEIEADFQRKELVKKFRDRIKMIQNQEMDEIDLKRAMDIIQEDYKIESKQLEDMSIQCDVTNNSKSEAQGPSKFEKLKQLIMFTRHRTGATTQLGNEC